MPERRRQVLMDLLAGAVIAAAVCILGVSREYSLLRSLCDGAFVAAVALLGIGGITLARNKGTFDVAGFGAKIALETMLPFLRSHEKETMMEYKERKEKSRKSPRALFIAGGVYLALSIAFLIVYSLVD